MEERGILRVLKTGDLIDIESEGLAVYLYTEATNGGRYYHWILIDGRIDYIIKYSPDLLTSTNYILVSGYVQQLKMLFRSACSENTGGILYDCILDMYMTSKWASAANHGR